MPDGRRVPTAGLDRQHACTLLTGTVESALRLVLGPGRMVWAVVRRHTGPEQASKGAEAPKRPRAEAASLVQKLAATQRR
jgi:hypothetical protein